MFDILVYLFETYCNSKCPEQLTLQARLSAAGFHDDEINEALNWLYQWDEMETVEFEAALQSSKGFRCFTDNELSKLDPASRGFLVFLETAGALNALQRELILERIFALNTSEITLKKVKLIILMVLWKQGKILDSLVLGELLTSENKPCMH